VLRAHRLSVSPAHTPYQKHSETFLVHASRLAGERLAELIQSEFHDSNLFVVKDPRISKLLPLWIELLADIDVDVVVVMTFRTEAEAGGDAASVARAFDDLLRSADGMTALFRDLVQNERAERKAFENSTNCG
jgi:hypothetical protein